MKRTGLAILLTAGLLALAGCETAKGLGRDITNAAEAVDRAI